jgi:hypothetical protein
MSTAFLVLISVHAYGIAYSFEKDFFTWCFIGLGLSTLMDAYVEPTEDAITDRT